MGHVEGKRIVVTGSTRCMGRGFAAALAAEGARLVINGTNADKLGEIEAEIIAAGGTAEPVLGSVAEPVYIAPMP